jgi:glycosyltransferase involved in cell wall biosynthesis
MRTKRILFAISTQHFKIAGGIGQFYRGFVEHADQLDCYVDLCFDKAPMKSVLDNISGVWCVPESVMDYKSHRNFHAFEDGINWEMVVNFRNSIHQAFKSNLYTHVIANTPEATMALKMMGLKNVQCLSYTHQESFTQSPDDFKSNPTFSIEYLKEIRNLDGITLGCQSECIQNHAMKFADDTRVLPFFFPESEAPAPVPAVTSGVIFIGRWEERKNPKMFIDLIKQTGLPAKVLTNKRGSEKFRVALTEISADYEIKFEITGREKSDFISSARMAFAPNRAETGPFSVYEAITRTRTLIPHAAEWAGNFHDYGPYYFGSPDSYKDIGLADQTMVIYNTLTPYVPMVTYHELNAYAIPKWASYLCENDNKRRSQEDYRNGIFKTVRADINTTFTVGDLIPDTLHNQTSINQITEFFNCHDVSVGFTDTGTYISIGELNVPVNKSDTMGSLFDFG